MKQRCHFDQVTEGQAHCDQNYQPVFENYQAVFENSEAVFENSQAVFENSQAGNFCLIMLSMYIYC